MQQSARNLQQVGAVMRRFRRKAGLTQAELGARANLRQATVSGLERGEVGVNLQTLLDAMHVLGLEMLLRERQATTDRIEDLF
jgi:HTH-type transcriptional regulator/antitoxin HipB